MNTVPAISVKEEQPSAKSDSRELEGKTTRKQREVDFAVDQGSQRYYIQVECGFMGRFMKKLLGIFVVVLGVLIESVFVFKECKEFKRMSEKTTATVTKVDSTRKKFIEVGLQNTGQSSCTKPVSFDGRNRRTRNYEI